MTSVDGEVGLRPGETGGDYACGAGTEITLGRGGKGKGDDFAIAGEKEVVQVVGVSSYGESEGRGKQRQGEESFAHRVIPFVRFVGPICGIRIHPSHGGVKMRVWPVASYATVPWLPCNLK